MVRRPIPNGGQFMRFAVLTLAFASVIACGVLIAQQQPATPSPWAYGFATPPGPAGANAPAAAPAAAPGGQAAQAPPDTTMHKLPGSDRSFTLTQIRDQYGPADWFPGDHPAMPDIVAHGRRDAQVAACSLCHYPNGKGRPENAGVSGLPYSYFVQTMMDFKNDKRKSADTRKANTNRMISFAKAMTDDEIKQAATYFSSMKWTPWIRVVEAGTVPKTRIAGGMFLVLEGAEAGKEPIGQRIIETPEKTEDTEQLRNSHSGFIAYVPPGSIKKGEAIVTTGAGKTTQCAVCHGADLEGLGPVPGLAGRSPSYIVRQLQDMQLGTRKGEWTDLMKPVVAKLTAEDMLNIAAYTASRVPGESRRSAR
ncbi:MAG: cytochrome C-binding protein [Acidobacteria bacterium]|nr:MAG: cytochrome C-binding protein [Acidobacteriota bacterium]